MECYWQIECKTVGQGWGWRWKNEESYLDPNVILIRKIFLSYEMTVTSQQGVCAPTAPSFAHGIDNILLMALPWHPVFLNPVLQATIPNRLELACK